MILCELFVFSPLLVVDQRVDGESMSTRDKVTLHSCHLEILEVHEGPRRIDSTSIGSQRRADRFQVVKDTPSSDMRDVDDFISEGIVLMRRVRLQVTSQGGGIVKILEVSDGV